MKRQAIKWAPQPIRTAQHSPGRSPKPVTAAARPPFVRPGLADFGDWRRSAQTGRPAGRANRMRA
eukprot:scaffold10186_cov154-Isochrysis_galbana.AAC.1